MDFKRIDMQSYARRAHFEYFSSLAYPYIGATVNIDITEFLLRTKAAGQPFFLSFLYHVSNAANAVAELRRRILDGCIVEFGRCATSHTVALEDGTFCYCKLDSSAPSLAEFLPYAREKQEDAKRMANIEDGEDAISLIFTSSTPWFSYTSIVQPVPMPADSNPRITWGRYFEQNGRMLIPVTVLCHHALVDGIHLASFFDGLKKRLDG